MPKLKLSVDALRVESFAIAAPSARGTVRAESDVKPIPSDPIPDPPYSECGHDCMSGDSWCPILSCGSGCDTDDCSAVKTPGGHADG